jgi:hypothetical protein
MYTKQTNLRVSVSVHQYTTSYQTKDTYITVNIRTGIHRWTHIYIYVYLYILDMTYHFMIVHVCVSQENMGIFVVMIDRHYDPKDVSTLRRGSAISV